jgi:uncharacterized protein
MLELYKERIVSEQENAKVVEQVYGRFKSGDIQSLLNLLSDDVEWELPNIENVPFAGKRHGREQVGEFFKALADTQEVQHFEPKEFIAQGDKVVALGHYHWRVKSTTARCRRCMNILTPPLWRLPTNSPNMCSVDKPLYLN